MAKDFLSDVDFKDNLVTLTSTDAGSSAGPILELYRNSSSPADADYIGQIKFQGRHDGGAKALYAKITGKIGDASDGSEDGIIEIAHQKAGSNNISARFTSTALKLINGTGLEIADGLLTLGSTAVTSTAAELNLLDGITAGTVSASLAVIADSNKDVTGFRNVTLTGILNAVNFKVNGGQGSDGQVLTSTGSGVAWESAAGGGSPAGSNTQVQFNNSGSFGADADFCFDGTRLLLKNSDDVDLDAVSGALITGGDGTGQHLAYNGNEITSKSDATTAGILYLNPDGGSVRTGTSTALTDFTIKGPLVVGVDDTGHDVKFFGATSGSYMLWDESADALIVNAGPIFATAKMQTGQSSYTQEPWSASTIALGNYGSIGTQGSYRTYMSWNYERGTDSNFHHLDINSYPQAGHVAIGNSGILFGYDDDFETTHTANPTTRITIDATGFSAMTGTAANPSISFTGDRDCGLYYTTEDNGSSTVAVVAIATDGVVRATFGDDIADMKSAKIKTTDIIQGNEFRAADNGPSNDPSFTFVDDGDSGWYRYAANSLACSVGGNEVWYVSDAGNNVWKTHTNATAYNYFLAGGGANSIIYMGDTSSNTTMGGIYTTGSGYLYTRAGNAWRTRQSSGEFRPYYDSAMTLGSSAARWTQLYADTATISTSDVNLKTDIVDTTLGLDFIKALRPISYKWKKTDGGKDGVRNHQGFIAQEVKTLLDAQSGTDASKQALWVDFSVSGEEEQLPDQDDPEKMVTVPAPTDQALRYEELIAPMVKAIQELEARVASLES